jgi:hypothetical protein
MIIFAQLKKLTGILFLLIFLCATTETAQLLKLPVLLHHYLEHHSDDTGKSFTDFLKQHYSEENSHTSENNEHQKLPFKYNDVGFWQVILVFQSAENFDFQTVRPVSTKENIVCSTAFLSFSVLSKIWQPPKFC